MVERRERETEILIVPYCHPDWAWTHSREWHAERYALAFREALAIFDAQEAAGIPGNAPHAFRWYLDVFITQLQPFLDRYPELVPRLKHWVSVGRIAICGTYANVRVNHVEGETFTRSMIYGWRAFRALFPDADLSVHADLVDVAWGHPQLPQLLQQAGYRYLRGWRPHDALNAKGIPHHFRWKGLDGTEVLCSRGSYGGVYHPNYIAADYRDRWPAVVRFWEEHELDEKRRYAPVPLLWVQHGADDNRPLRAIFWIDTSLDLVGFIQEWNQREASQMRFATPVEAFTILDQRRDQLPVVDGTIDPCDVCYNAAWSGSRGLWWWRRLSARTLLQAETLSVLAQTFGHGYPQEQIEQLWRDTLLFSCHATQWLFEDDFTALKRLAEVTTWQARQLADRAARVLASQIHLPDQSLAVVLNPLPFERTVDLPLRISFVEGDQGGIPDKLYLLDGRDRKVPFQVYNELRHAGVRWEVDVLARLSLPAGGWTVLRWDRRESDSPEVMELPGAANANDLTLENELLELHLRRGHLIRIVDKTTGQADQTTPAMPFGRLRCYAVDTSAPLHVGPIQGYQDAEWTDWAIIEYGPLRQVARLQGHVGAHPATLDIRLPTGTRRLEFAVTIEWRGMDGFLAFEIPLLFDGQLWGGVPYGVEQKVLEHEPYVGIERQREGMFWAQEFVDWTDGTRGLAYIPHNGDAYYILDSRQRSLAHILINSFRRPRENWEKDINEAIEGEGRHTFTSSVLFHPGDWRTARIWQVARDLTTPPLVVYQRHGQGALPSYLSILAVEPANVVLAALYREGDSILVRLYETSGQEADATVHVPIALRRVAPVNLLNQPLTEGAGELGLRVSADGRQVSLHLRPWEIRTIALEAGG